MKKALMSLAGIVGGAITSLFGPWTTAMTSLFVLMVIDWITGLVCAGVFKASKKTENGGLSSKVGFRGLAKKCMIILFVLIGARLDLFFGGYFIRDGICMAFIVNELLSIIENAGIMGIPIPAPLRKAVDILQGTKEDGKNNGED